MLKKLFKYDMKWILKFMIPFILITILSSVLNRVFFELKSINFIFNILYITTVVITNGLIVNLIFNIIIRNIFRFKSQLYGDESYLLHTLPVKRSDIIISKVLSSSLSIFIAIIVGIFCIAIEYLTLDLFDMLRFVLNGISNEYGINSVLVLILLMFYIIVSIILITEVLYASIILGYRSNYKKVLKCFIYVIIFYVVIEILNLLGIGVLSLFNHEVFNLLKTNEVTTKIVKPLVSLFIFLNVIYVIIFYIINIKSINKKLNID